MNNALLRLLKVRNQLLIIADAQYLFHDRLEKTAAGMFKLVKTIADYNALTVMPVGDERINDYVYSIEGFANRGYNRDVLRPLTAGKNDMHKFEKPLGSIDDAGRFSTTSCCSSCSAASSADERLRTPALDPVPPSRL
ncbi:hypothetical protein ACVITL_006714 [Rhizobium pisi]